MYVKTNWENLPSTNTPVNASNLNKIESIIDYVENYSTSETKIGTWIDGKPIYRKVFHTYCPSQTLTITAVGSITDLNVNKGVKLEGYINASTVYINANYYFSDTDHSVLWIDPTTNEIRQQMNNVYLGADLFIVFEYTKTTD